MTWAFIALFFGMLLVAALFGIVQMVIRGMVSKWWILLALCFTCWIVAWSSLCEAPYESANLIAYVATRTGVISDHPPSILVVEPAAFRLRHCWKHLWRCNVGGIYDGARIEINGVLRQPLLLRGVIIHELVHWAQHHRGMRLGECIDGAPTDARWNSEKQAYRMQNQWLAEHGGEPMLIPYSVCI